MKLKAWAPVLALALSSCIHAQLQENTLETISTVEDLRFHQFMDNLSDAIDTKDRIPSLVIINTGQAQTSMGGTLALQLPAMNFSKNTKTLNPTATGTWTDYWSLSPIADPQDLQNLRALYRLVYTSDNDILPLINDTERVYQWRDPSKIGNMPECGVLHIPPKMIDPEKALNAYFAALKAFPAILPSPGPGAPQTGGGAGNPAPQSAPAPQPTGHRPPIKPAAAAPPPAAAPIGGNCYDKAEGEAGIAAGLSQFYGLAYPTTHEVYTDLRNGLSLRCRRYQLQTNAVNPQDPRSTLRSDRIFTRWLFWYDDSGKWHPEDPPAGAKMESLGQFGLNSREFFYAHSANSADPTKDFDGEACISDFMILATEATANSHASALASPKGSSQAPPQ